MSSKQNKREIKKNTDTLTRKLAVIQNFIFGTGESDDKKYISSAFAQYQASIAKGLSLPNDVKYTVFISVCSADERAQVVRFSASSLERAWRSCLAEAVKLVSKNELLPVWVKADIMKKADIRDTGAVMSEAVLGRRYSYMHGIAFDRKLKTALLESELNCMPLIPYEDGQFSLDNLNSCLQPLSGLTFDKLPPLVAVFDCDSVFCNEDDEVISLCNDGDAAGHRYVDGVDEKLAVELALSGAHYLESQLGCCDTPGFFHYGFYAGSHQPIDNYNMIRHAGTVWAMACACRHSSGSGLLTSVKNALDFMLTFAIPASNGASYMLDPENAEYKLGANAVAVAALAEYMDAANSRMKNAEFEGYHEKLITLGKGIISMQNSNGSFIHVLHSETFKLKDHTRTAFYDSEAAYALAKLYTVTGDSIWLDAARKAIDYMIAKDYTKYRDHWTAFALNEFTRHVKEEKYIEFGLRNASANLKRIYNHPNAYPVYLELLCRTLEMYGRLTDEGCSAAALEDFPAESVKEAIRHRARLMLNSYTFPEIAMYMKYPERVAGAFFIRQDNFRIRIDDVQHFIGGYLAYADIYDQL